jgi:HTH-type transcriptional regulator / antitoxin HigA
MGTKIARSGGADNYTELVKEFRLVQIRDDEHLRAAHEMIDRLLRADLDPSGQDYLGVLAQLVEAYEDLRFPIAEASESDVLRELMRSNGLGQNALARKVGISQSTISAVLNGHRNLTKDHVIRLAKFFNVEPTAFLPGGRRQGQEHRSSGTAPTAGGSVHGIAAARRT